LITSSAATLKSPPYLGRALLFGEHPRGLRHDDACLHPAVTLRRALARRRHARRLARRPKALPKEQKPEFTELVTEAMTAANKMG